MSEWPFILDRIDAVASPDPEVRDLLHAVGVELQRLAQAAAQWQDLGESQRRQIAELTHAGKRNESRIRSLTGTIERLQNELARKERMAKDAEARLAEVMLRDSAAPQIASRR